MSNSKIEKINNEFWNVKNTLKGMDVPEIRKNRQSFPFSICIENLSGDLNVGMIIRSAEIFGCSKVYILGKKRYDKRSTVGAHNYIDIEYIETIEDISETPYLVGIENIMDDVRSTELTSFSSIPPNTVFVFGCEADGLSQNIIDLCNQFCYIKQHGVLRCLNVSAAAAIILHELANHFSWKSD